MDYGVLNANKEKLGHKRRLRVNGLIDPNYVRNVIMHGVLILVINVMLTKCLLIWSQEKRNVSVLSP